jgi:lipopolysaccharide export system protein LptA
MIRLTARIGRWGAAAVVGASILIACQAGAQVNNKGPANPLQGFSTNREKPVRIQAASLEVRDKDKVATFSGDVHVTQGDTVMRCKILVVFYEGEAAKGGAPTTSQNGAQGQPQIRRMEAKGGVIVTQKDQIATGDRGDYDMRTNTVTLIGNVVVTRGQDVMRGQRLVVDLTNGVSKVDSGGGRVELLVDSKPPRQDPNKSTPPAEPARPIR